MAESHHNKITLAPKEEEEEEEEKGEEEEEGIIDTSLVVVVAVERNPLSELLPTIVLPNYTLEEEAVFRDQKSESETLASTSFPPPPPPPPSSLENNNFTSFSELLLLTGDILCCSSSSVDSLLVVASSSSVAPTPTTTTSLQLQEDSLELPSGYQATSSTSNPISLQQRPLPVLEENNFFKPEVNEQKSFEQNTKPVHAVMRTPSTDGYNWRKYGQKQVKSTESSRSYYRCTYVNCHAKKKVERCDHSGQIIEIIYKGRHNHDPPQKVRCTKARRLISSGTGLGSTTMDDSLQKLKYSAPSPSRKETRHVTPEQQLKSSGKCDQKVRVKVEENQGDEQGDEPDAKRRIQDNSVSYSFPLLTTIKEPKIVVQAASDVGISGDGYRWRKYGQKMVKGNPNPRSYYKCTSAGCPVRKHVERSMDDTTAVIITYEGQHDHGMPVPKKRHGPPSAALVIAAAAAMNSAQLKKSEALTTQSANEKTLERGGEKVLESARTLLSIGIELKPY